MRNGDKNGRKGEEGYALASVLIVVTFLSIIALSLGGEFRTGSKVYQQRLAMSQSEALAEAALAEATLRLSERDRSKRWAPDGAEKVIDIQGINVEIRVSDELGRLDLNMANPEHLLDLIKSQVGDEKAAKRLQSAIQDWRDADLKAQPGGAEAAAYRQAGKGFLPRNADFETVSELKWVLGVTPEIYACLAPMLTVHSQRRAIDPSNATEELKRALSLASTKPQGHAVSAIQGGMGGRAVRIEVKVPMGRSQFYKVTGVLRLTEDRNDPFWILAVDNEVRADTLECSGEKSAQD